MKLLKIYDGRTLGELNNGREFFTRAEFEGPDGTLYGGFKDGPRYRFHRVEYNWNKTRQKRFLVRKKSKLEKQMLAMLIEHEDNAPRWKEEC